nr:hypothetical protein K-LCC10_0450 [Kaumoebavirus]
MDVRLTQNGVSVKVNELAKIYPGEKLQKFRRKFYVRTKIREGVYKAANIYSMEGPTGDKSLILPRMGAFKFLPKQFNVTYEIPAFKKIKISKKASDGLTLKEYQAVALEYLTNNFFNDDMMAEGKACCTFQMQPGAGKTYLAMGLIRYLSVKTLIIVPNTFLLKQWKTDLVKIFGESKIGEFSGTKKVDSDITLMVINSALADEFLNRSYEEYFELFGLAIFDEVHMYCSDERKKIFERTNLPYVLGMTATPGERLDAFDVIYYRHLGEPIMAENIPGFSYSSIQFTGRVKAIAYSGPASHTAPITNESNGMLSVAAMINQFADDSYRNQLIVDEIYELYEKGHNIFVFSDRRAHLVTLETSLKAKGVVTFIDDGEKPTQVLVGGSTDDQITHARKNARVILTTYGYSDTGVSIDKMDALVFATPRKSQIKQKVGRIFRAGGDNAIQRVIVDIIDANTALKRQYSSRKKIYDLRGFQIERVKKNYTDINVPA